MRAGALLGRIRRLGAARFDPYWIAAVLTVAYALLSVCRYRRMATMSWDLGIFEEAIRNYAHLHAPVADLKGPGANLLGDHFSPIIATLAPVYRVFPTPVTLLTAQAVLFAVSSVPVTRLAARLLGRTSGVAIGAAYGLSWGVQRAVDFDFHEIAFAVPLIAFALEAVVRQRWRAAFWWSVPLVLVKEDLGITVAAIGVLLLWQVPKDDGRLRRALGLTVFGIAAFVLTVTVIIPAFNAGGGYDYWTKIGESDGPGWTTHWFDIKLKTVLWLLFPTTGLLALRSPLLVVALPTLAWRFASGDEHYWSTDWHYSAVVMPVIFLALVDAMDRCRRGGPPWLDWYVRRLPTAVLAAALALTTNLPLSDLTSEGTYRAGPRAAAAQRLLAGIPDGATVEANVPLISHLTNRTRVFWIGDTRGIVPQYIALDVSGSGGMSTDAELIDYARQLHPSATYSVSGADNGYAILQLAK